jgi:dienelactone hydrolase
LEYFAGNGFNVLMPYSYYYSDEREPWVYDVVASVMHDTRLRHIYIVGFSSGGVVAANVIMGSTVFEKAVIIDAALCGYYGKTEDIFSSAYTSSRVEIPHLLVWGANDSITPIVQAKIWMKNADPNLARLRIFQYEHDFRGTAIEDEVKLEILRFLRPNGFLENFIYFLEVVIAVAVVAIVFQSRARLKK